MQLTTRLPKRRRSSRPTRTSPASPDGFLPRPDGSSPADASQPSARAPQSEDLEPPEPNAARRGGGPEDQALYSCLCGFAFKAAVTTSVDCPHCGTEQAW
jgi:hypothetical protein